MINSDQYIDKSTGATADSVYITTIEGEEIASIPGRFWTDELISRLEKKYGHICAEFQGGTLDGFEAFSGAIASKPTPRTIICRSFGLR
jgi:hypothetical protein